VNDGDLSPFESLLTVLSTPYEDQPAFGRYVDPDSIGISDCLDMPSRCFPQMA
jgi:hypothetical protein